MSIIRVTVFVDWNAQMHKFGTKRIVDPLERAHLTLARIGTAVSDILKTYRDHRFVATIRLYAGWHRGVDPTEERRAVERASTSGDWRPNSAANVHVEKDVQFGDRLLAAADDRLVHRRNFHLPDTLRNVPNDTKRHREKMVDTALVADLIAHSRSNVEEWRLVLSEDDDVIPGVLVASYWTRHSRPPTCTKLVRGQLPSTHFRLHGLLETVHLAGAHK